MGGRGGGVGSGGGVGLVGVRVDVIEELKFLGKFTQKKNWGGGSGGLVWGVGGGGLDRGGGSGWWGSGWM